jgi:hypothetical protein
MKEEESKGAEGESNEGKSGAGDCYPTESMSPMDFSTFVLSLASSAMVNLGIVADSDAPQGEPDLMAARQLIDIIGVLEEKTRGNLTDAEDKLLKSLLYDLRVQYCDAQQR